MSRTVKSQVLSLLNDNLSEDITNSCEIDAELILYLENILEGDKEDLDVEDIAEMLEAYIPPIASIERSITYAWLISVVESLQDTSNIQDETVVETTASDSQCLGAVGGDVITDLSSSHFSSRSSSNSSSSQCSSNSLSSSASSGPRQEVVDSERLEERHRLVDALKELFPQETDAYLERCAIEAGECFNTAIDLVLSDSCRHLVNTQKTTFSRSVSQDSSIKDAIVEKYGLVPDDQEAKTCRPVLPKSEKIKKVRYLNGQVVDTKGSRFIEIKDEKDQGPKPAHLKALRKYRFH